MFFGLAGRSVPIKSPSNEPDMKLRILLVALLALKAVGAEYQNIKQEGEKLYGEKSFGLAHGAYQKAQGTALPEPEQRWVEFRLADTQWRSEAATEKADTTKLDQARQQLEKLI